MGPAPTVSPATTSTPTVAATRTASARPTESSPPTVDAITMTLVLQLDKFSAETAWFINSGDGTTSYVARPNGYYEEMKSEKVIETIRLPEGLEYQFKILDFMGESKWFD